MIYIKYFNKNDDYQNCLTSGKIVKPNVSYILDVKDIDYYPIIKLKANPKNCAGSIMLYDKTTDKNIFVMQDKLSLSDYPLERYLPMGVVAIPVSHDVYGNGKCGVMSLKAMSCYYPDEGTTYDSPDIRWGDNDYDIPNLPNLDKVPLISTSLSSNDIIGVGAYGFIPSTYFNTNIPTENKGMDTKAGYHSRFTEGTIPSPYLEDGSRNPSYYSTDVSINAGLSANCLSDFNGYENTQILCNAATAQTNWRTDEYIENEVDDGYYPAACCCWRFNPNGKTQGKWYLPAAGELGYVLSRLKEIKAGIEKVIEIYGFEYGTTFSHSGHWCSSEQSYNIIRYSAENFGAIGDNGYKQYVYCVRAFITE